MPKKPSSPNEQVPVVENVIVVLENQETKKKRIFRAKNIVTTAGDVYYAQMAAGDTPTNDFDAAGAGIRLGTGTATPTKSDTDVTTENSAGRPALDASYPASNDSDADNSGAGTTVVTWRYSYTTAEGNITDIAELAIVDDRTTPTAALCHALFTTPFTKTSSDTLKVFVNHTFLGS